MNYVEPVGPTNAKIVFVGDYPRGMESIPFSHPSDSNMLTELCALAGIPKSQVYMTYIVKVCPPASDISRLSVEEKELWIERFYKELDKLSPNVIVPMSVLKCGIALSTLTDRAGLTKYRGSILTSPYTEAKVIPTYHPSDILKQYELKAIALLDFKRIADEAKTSALVRPFRQYIIEPTFRQVMDTLQDMMDNAEYISFDIETFPNVVSCLGLSDRPDRAICIPFIRDGGAYWPSRYEEAEIWQAIGRLWQMDKKFVAQNAMYDCAYLARYHGLWPQTGIYMDTMLAHKACYAEFPKGLNFLCAMYTKEPYYKDEGKEWKNVKNWHQYWTYNCKDAAITLEVCHALEKEVVNFGVQENMKHMLDMIEPLLVTTLRGVKFDSTYVKELKEISTVTLAAAEVKLNELVGEPVNVKSPKQLHTLLFTKMGLPMKIKGKTGKVTTDSEALKELARSHPSPIFDAIFDIRKHAKLIGFLNSPVDTLDGRMRCSYNIAGTETGRLSSSGSMFGGGTNLQNIQHGPTRKLFCCDQGKKGAYSDLAQAEARIVGYQTRDESLIKIFEDPARDIHTEMACEIFGIPADRVREEADIPHNINHFSYRDLSKRAIHACDYDIGSMHLGKILGVPTKVAEGIKSKYYATHPLIRQNQLNIQRQLKMTCTLNTIFGRRRYFHGRMDEATFREAYAYIPQSMVGDLLNMGLKKVYKELGDKVDILLQVHDAIMWQADEDIFDSLVSQVEECLQIPLEMNGFKFIIPADTKVGYNWGEME